jgi:G3E family GTPase
LSQNHGKKIAVIENEFGEIGIDDALIKGKETLGEDSEEAELTILENGCLCCTVRGDLVEAVANLVERGGFDHIVIETTGTVCKCCSMCARTHCIVVDSNSFDALFARSLYPRACMPALQLAKSRQQGVDAGLANPAPIISTFLLEPSLAERVRLDGICTVVDAKHVSSHLDRSEEEGKENEASSQVAYADRIVLNKPDLVSKEELESLEARIRNMNRLATIERALHSKVSADYVLGIGGYALDQINAQVRRPAPVRPHHVQQACVGYSVRQLLCRWRTNWTAWLVTAVKVTTMTMSTSTSTATNMTTAASMRMVRRSIAMSVGIATPQGSMTMDMYTIITSTMTPSPAPASSFLAPWTSTS